VLACGRGRGQNAGDRAEIKMQRHDLTPAMDLEQPSQARIHDYLLGGSLNFAADREAARRLLERVPEAALGAQANRAFLRRAVCFLVDAGVRQFLDIGSGIPNRGNVHEVAQELAPECRVAYVDIDPVAVMHGRQVLAGNDRTVVVQADARRPDRILAHPDVRCLLDLTQPVAVLLVSVLHYIPDTDDPAGIVAGLRDAVTPGSYLALTHLISDHKPDLSQDLPPVGEPGGMYAILRPEASVRRYFAGFDLVEPGFVDVLTWRPDGPGRPDGDPVRSCLHVGVGRKP